MNIMLTKLPIQQAIQRRKGIEKCKNISCLSKKRQNFYVQRQFNVDVSTVIYSLLKKHRKIDVESTSKFWLTPLVSNVETYYKNLLISRHISFLIVIPAEAPKSSPPITFFQLYDGEANLNEKPSQMSLLALWWRSWGTICDGPSYTLPTDPLGKLTKNISQREFIRIIYNIWFHNFIIHRNQNSIPLNLVLSWWVKYNYANSKHATMFCIIQYFTSTLEVISHQINACAVFA